MEFGTGTGPLYTFCKRVNFVKTVAVTATVY